jgi:hypothetical protein
VVVVLDRMFCVLVLGTSLLVLQPFLAPG